MRLTGWPPVRRAVCLGMTVCAAARMAGAQGTVRGQVTLTERDGSGPPDASGAVVYLEPASGSAINSASSSVGNDAGPSAAAPLSAEIAMRGREFVPHVRVVLAGGSVAFPNEDPFSHNVFSNTATNAFDLGLYRRNASRSARFTLAGVYPVYCNIHHRMVSFVVAVPARYAALVAVDGRFAIAGVPAGAYVLHTWHERAGEITQSVTVPAAGATDLRLVLDARGYVPTPHPNKFGLPYTATRADRY